MLIDQKEQIKYRALERIVEFVFGDIENGGTGGKSSSTGKL